MDANSFGNILKATSFGESHGPAVGVVIEGCPAELPFDFELLKKEMNRRRPGMGRPGVSPRNESDEVEILSGLYEGKTLGTPITMIVKNQDTRPEDYERLKENPRQWHADQTWVDKFGHTDPRGGGRSSGRETAARVMVGALAQMLAQKLGLSEARITSEVWHKGERLQEAQLLEAATQNESLGAEVILKASGFPKGLGQPVFKKIKSDLASALMGIGGVVGFEFGAGFQVTGAKGKDLFKATPQEVLGGIQGGMTNGDDLLIKIAFKPTSSIEDVAKFGRHDPCIAVRGAVVAEAMVWWVLVDHLLWSRLDRL